jgi:hypothetical protein
MEPPMKSLRFALLASPVLALAAPFASAADSLALDPVSIWLGGYYANTEVNVRGETHDGDVSTGKIRLDSGDETVGRARLDVLLFGSQGLQFDYYTLDHSTTQNLSEPFSFQGVPFALDTQLLGKFEFSAGTAAYHWWFGDATDAFGAGLGGAYYRAKLKVSGTVALAGQTADGSASWDADAVAPLVTLGYRHAFNDSLRVYLEASGIYKSGGSLSGHLYDGRAGIEWFPWHNVGLAAEYGETRLKLDHEGSSYDANLDIKLHGPSLFARFRF